MAETAFLFPGQGSQYVGMGGDLFDRFPAARDRFERADARLGFRLSDYMFGRLSAAADGGNADDAQDTGGTVDARDAAGILAQTDVTQPALYVHSLAAMAVLQEHGMEPAMCAGHSLGEYSALAAANAIDFEAGLEIVRMRGRLMAEAGERRPGTMAAVLGMDDDDVVRVCSEASNAPASVVEPANFNAPGQVVISGDRDAVERAMTLAGDSGAKRVVLLPVSGAFHSPLMEYAREGLAKALNDIDIQVPSCPLYLNVTAEPTTDPGEIRLRLLEQLTAPVRWSQTLRCMRSHGATRFVEVGAGSVLSGLVRRTLGRDVVTCIAGSAEELESIAVRIDG